MHVAQFIHRYPPALGGSEAYTARLCEYLAANGDAVDVWTTTAVALEAFWRRDGHIAVGLPAVLARHRRRAERRRYMFGASPPCTSPRGGTS